MADWYVDSNAAGAGTGADWTNAYTTLKAAMEAKAAGDRFFVAHNHAETGGAALTITSPGTLAAPQYVFCVNSGGTVPPVSADLRTTGTVTTTGTSAITLLGVAYFYGLTFNVGTGASAANLNLVTTATNRLQFEACNLKMVTTSSATQIRIGVTSATVSVFMKNTVLTFGHVGQGIRIDGAKFYWTGTASALGGATFPTNLFATNTQSGEIYLRGVDLSALGSNTIVAAPIGGIEYFFDQCKLGSGFVIGATPTAHFSNITHSLSANANNYTSGRIAYEGTQSIETTIVRTGGASDGTQSISWKIVTTANSNQVAPFDATPIYIWNETTGSSVTATVQGIWGGGAVPNKEDIWIEVEYMGTSGNPLASIATSGQADLLAASAAVAAGSGTWGGSTTKFALSATFTPQVKGPLAIRVRAAKALSTFYIDPLATLS